MVASITGMVEKGHQIGRAIGFPTANLFLEPQHPVKDGVYAVMVECEGSCYRGIASIGPKPTVTEESVRNLEVHLFDFQDNLYGKSITVHLLMLLREIAKFDSLEALSRQIMRDKEAALCYFQSL